MPTEDLQPSAAAGLDTYLSSTAPNNNYGITAAIATGQGSTDVRRGLLKFDLSAIPAGATIVSAILTLECNSVFDNNSRNVALHRSLVEWFEGDANGAAPSGDGSTWNHRNANGAVAWSGGAGGASGTEWDAAATDTTAITTVGTYTWDVAADIQAFVDGTYTNHGWWVIGSEGTNFHGKSFAASDDGTPGDRPQLVIEYNTGLEVDVADSLSVTDAATVLVLNADSIAASAVDSVGVAESVSAAVDDPQVDTGDGVGVGESIDLETTSFVAVVDAVNVADAATVATVLNIAVSDSIGVDEARRVFPELLRRPPRAPAPLLYITDGTVRSNGQLNRLDLLGGNGGGYCLDGWNPAIAQYKNGGSFADSPQATGRRLVQRIFANVVEVMVLKLRAKDQDEAARFQQDLLRWQEQAADYRASTWTGMPVYLAARSAYETNTRYALIEIMSVPELATNVYDAPFLGGSGRGHAGAYIPELTLRLERGQWAATPPGQGEAVAVSSFRGFTVTGWSS